VIALASVSSTIETTTATAICGTIEAATTSAVISATATATTSAGAATSGGAAEVLGGEVESWHALQPHLATVFFMMGGGSGQPSTAMAKRLAVSTRSVADHPSILVLEL